MRKTAGRSYDKELVGVLRAFRRGDFSVVPPAPAGPGEREISEEIEAIFELNRRLAGQLQKISSRSARKARSANARTSGACAAPGRRPWTA